MKKWKITYDKYCKGVEKLNSLVQTYLDYNLMCTLEEDKLYNNIYTKIDSSIEGYITKVIGADENQSIYLIAEDEANLMYAVSDFKNKYLPKEMGFFDARAKKRIHRPKLFYVPFSECEISCKPRIKDRGIWTWGFVIYDYKKFIDNMVTLRLNTLIIWNDYLPTNVNDVIEYAHQNGIKIYFGFEWGWDTEEEILSLVAKCDEIYKKVVDNYTTNYKGLNCDGFYFQSFTESEEDNVDGISIAETVVGLVNKIARKLFEEEQDLKLLFGLHATSVKDKLDIIKNVDERISIIWENAGAFPFANSPDLIDGFEETIEFTQKIQNLRNAGFGTVLKGLIRIDWENFKHQDGKALLGVIDDKVKMKEYAEERKEVLKYIQAYWIANAKYAHELIKTFNEDAMTTFLCEDGLFEEFINYPAALYAQMMWDSDRTTDEILIETATMPDVEMV